MIKSKPHIKLHFKAHDILISLALVGLTALLAQIRVPLPFSPVPISGQTLAVFLTAALLSPKKAFFTQLAYITLGGLGLPIFAHFSFGLAILFGPTGGYLIGFPFCALLASYMIRQFESQKHKKLFMSLIFASSGLLTIFTLGLIQLHIWTTNTMPESTIMTTLQIGLIPFIPGLIFKSVVAQGLCLFVKK